MEKKNFFEAHYNFLCGKESAMGQRLRKNTAGQCGHAAADQISVCVEF
jgi:hypothetical protein